MHFNNPNVWELAIRLAAGQHGVVTRQQLLAAGAPEITVDRYVATRRLKPVHRGVYLIGSLRGGLVPARAPQMAAVLACGSGAVLSHRSAGRLWGILRAGNPPRDWSRPENWTGPGGWGRPGSDGRGPAPVDVTIPGAARRRRPGIAIHHSDDLSPAVVTCLDDMPVTTPARTLRDLSTVLDPRALNRAAARAERQGLIDPTDLPKVVSDHGRRPGAPVLRAALLGDGGLILTRSEGEERLLELVEEAGLPRPRVNTRVAGYEVDFFWPGARLVVEVDGFAYHASRDRFEADRRRDGDLKLKGISVIRVTWRQIVREPLATAARIAGALAHAGAQR